MRWTTLEWTVLEWNVLDCTVLGCTGLTSERGPQEFARSKETPYTLVGGPRVRGIAIEGASVETSMPKKAAKKAAQVTKKAAQVTKKAAQVTKKAATPKKAATTETTEPSADQAQEVSLPRQPLWFPKYSPDVP
eukprot:332730-Pyramimonas_sp.AAC.1